MAHHNIIQWNCRGLRTRREEMELLIHKYSPVALCIQETKLSDNIQHKQTFSNHSCYYTSTENGSGGVGIIVKNSFLQRQISINTDLQAVAVSVTIDKKAYTLCSLYIPPSSYLDQSQLDDLKDQLPSPYIIMGDFNAHNPMWSSSYTNSKGTILQNFIVENDLILFNNKYPTHYDDYHQSSSLIDLTICQPSVFLDFNCNVFENGHDSDHYPIQLIYNGEEPPEKERLPRWNFKKADWKKFKNLCKDTLIDDLFTNSDVMEVYKNDKMRVFNENLLNVASESIPLTSTKITKKPKPWFDEECKTFIKKRNAAETKAKNHITEQNIYNSRMWRAKCRKTFKLKKRGSWRQFVSSINDKTPVKKVWDKIRKITGKNKGSKLHHIQDNNGDIITDKKEVANALGEQFEKCSSSSNYSPNFQKIKQNKEKNPIDFNVSSRDKKENRSYNKNFKLRDLKWAIKKSNNSTPGPDQIHYEILRHLPEETLKVLLKIINECWNSDYFPDSWREALIIPIPKPGKDHLYPINYRPIALTSCICKVVERMVNERLIWYLEKNKILNRQQCGFRKNRSTVDHLVRLETFIRDAFRHKEHVVAVFFDLEKAYDTTWKFGILQDMHKIGLRGNLPKFICNFLSDRTFQVLLGTTLSDTFTQEEGVPQGAILSTTLFNLKINDIAENLNPGVDSSLYVDDFSICYRSKTMPVIERRVQCQINELQKWTTENGYTFSQSKTVAMHFVPPYLHPNKHEPDPELHLDGHMIKVVPQTKFLGLIWDSKLNFRAHIDYLKKKCMKAMNVLKVLAHYDWGADERTLLHLYRSLIRSKLDYGCIVYGSASDSYIKELDVIQNQALRLCLGAFKSSPVNSLYVEANEPPLHYRRQQLSLQYGIRLKAHPNSPAYPYVFPTDYAYKFCLEKRAIPAFRVRFQKLLDSADINVENIANNEITLETPIWDMPQPSCASHLSQFKKDSTLPQYYKDQFYIAKYRFTGYESIYTDGSKCGNKVAFAFVTPESTTSERIPDGCSIFTAEAFAVFRSLQYIKSSPFKKFVIFTDSLSLIQSIEMENQKNSIVLSIFKILDEIFKQNKRVVFCWVPSHCGIPGNELADKAAKQALNQEITPISIPYTDKFPHIKLYLRQTWQEDWNSKVDNKLKRIKPILGPPYLIQTCRKDQVVINRIRIGHSRLSHSFLMDRRVGIQPRCHFCQSNKPLTVRHVIVKCTHFSTIRDNFFRVHNMKDLFKSVSSRNIIGYLKATGLYQQI